MRPLLAATLLTACTGAGTAPLEISWCPVASPQDVVDCLEGQGWSTLEVDPATPTTRSSAAGKLQTRTRVLAAKGGWNAEVVVDRWERGEYYQTQFETGAVGRGYRDLGITARVVDERHQRALVDELDSGSLGDLSGATVRRTLGLDLRCYEHRETPRRLHCSGDGPERRLRIEVVEDDGPQDALGSWRAHGTLVLSVLAVDRAATVAVLDSLAPGPPADPYGPLEVVPGPPFAIDVVRQVLDDEGWTIGSERVHTGGRDQNTARVLDLQATQPGRHLALTVSRWTGQPPPPTDRRDHSAAATAGHWGVTALVQDSGRANHIADDLARTPLPDLEPVLHSATWLECEEDGERRRPGAAPVTRAGPLVCSGDKDGDTVTIQLETSAATHLGSRSPAPEHAAARTEAGTRLDVAVRGDATAEALVADVVARLSATPR